MRSGLNDMGVATMKKMLADGVKPKIVAKELKVPVEYVNQWVEKKPKTKKEKKNGDLGSFDM